MSAWIIYALIWWMDNHLWEHEDVAGAKLIVYVWDLCKVCVYVNGDACQLICIVGGGLCSLNLSDGLLDICVLCILYVFLYFFYARSLEQIIDLHALTRCLDFLTQIPAHICKSTGTPNACTQTHFSVWRCIHSPLNHLNVVHFILVQRPLSSSPYFLFRRPPWHGKCQALLADAFWLLQTFVKC